MQDTKHVNTLEEWEVEETNLYCREMRSARHVYTLVECGMEEATNI